MLRLLVICLVSVLALVNGAPLLASCEEGFVYVSCGELGGSCGTVVAVYAGQVVEFWTFPLGSCYNPICGGGYSEETGWAIRLMCGGEVGAYFFGWACC